MTNFSPRFHYSRHFHRWYFTCWLEHWHRFRLVAFLCNLNSYIFNRQGFRTYVNAGVDKKSKIDLD